MTMFIIIWKYPYLIYIEARDWWIELNWIRLALSHLVGHSFAFEIRTTDNQNRSSARQREFLGMKGGTKSGLIHEWNHTMDECAASWGGHFLDRRKSNETRNCHLCLQSSGSKNSIALCTKMKFSRFRTNSQVHNLKNKCFFNIWSETVCALLSC